MAVSKRSEMGPKNHILNRFSENADQFQSSKEQGNITHLLELASGSDSTGVTRYKTSLQCKLH